MLFFPLTCFILPFFIIYDMTGRETVPLYNGTQAPGYHNISWEASGVYFIKMVAGDYISTQKLMLVK